MQEVLDKYFYTTKFMARETNRSYFSGLCPYLTTYPLLSDETWNKALFLDPELMALTRYQDFYIFFPISLLH